MNTTGWRTEKSADDLATTRRGFIDSFRSATTDEISGLCGIFADWLEDQNDPAAADVRLLESGTPFRVVSNWWPQDRYLGVENVHGWEDYGLLPLLYKFWEHGMSGDEHDVWTGITETVYGSEYRYQSVVCWLTDFGKLPALVREILHSCVA